MTDKPLTPKQRAFVAAYVGEAKGNGTQAARLAGYAGDDHTLSMVGTENLRKPAIMAALEVFRMATARKALKSAEDVAEWLCRVMDGVEHEPQPEGGEGPPKMRDRLTACGHYIKVRGLDRPTQGTDEQPAPSVSPDMERALIRLAQLTPEQWAAWQAGVWS